MMNMKCLQPLLTSPVDSAHETDPAGYSPPMPMPTWTGGREHSVRHREWGRAYEEAPDGQHGEHACGLAVVVGAGGQGGEDDEYDRGHEQRVGARPAVRQHAEDELADDGAGEGDGADDVLGLRARPRLAVLARQHRAHGPDHVVDVAVREEAGAARRHGQRDQLALGVDGREGRAARLLVRRAVVLDGLGHAGGRAVVDRGVGVMGETVWMPPRDKLSPGRGTQSLFSSAGTNPGRETATGRPPGRPDVIACRQPSRTRRPSPDCLAA